MSRHSTKTKQRRRSTSTRRDFEDRAYLALMIARLMTCPTECRIARLANSTGWLRGQWVADQLGAPR